MVMSNECGMALIWTFVCLATIFVALRLYVRAWLQGHFGAGDAFILAGWVVFVFVQCANTANYKMGQWGTIIGPDTFAELLQRYTPERLKTIMVLLWLAGPMSYTAVWCVKGAFLVFYYQLMGRHKRLRWTLHITTFFTVTGWIVSQYLSFFSCIPVKRNWAMDDTFCNSYSVPPAYWFSIAIHFFTDFIIYTLPFFLLPTLNLSQRKKMGVSGMFLLGTFSIGTVVARVTICGIPPFRQAPVNALSAMEAATALMVACCPPLKWLYMSFKYCPNASDAQTNTTSTDGMGPSMRVHSTSARLGAGMLTFTFGHGVRHGDRIDSEAGGSELDHDASGSIAEYSSDGTTLYSVGPNGALGDGKSFVTTSTTKYRQGSRATGQTSDLEERSSPVGPPLERSDSRDSCPNMQIPKIAFLGA